MLSTEDCGTERPATPVRGHLLAAGLVLVILLGIFGPALLADGVLLSTPTADLASYFVHWRAFGFGEMAAGNLPFWNPHVFCGAPFVGGAQSALFYPPNWIALLVSTERAVNLEIVLHLVLAAWSMIAWAAWRGLPPPASFVAGLVYALGGALLPHVQAGHLTFLAAAAWLPIVFLSVDALLSGAGVRAAIPGAAATGLLLLAGHPQVAFLGLVTVVLTVGFRYRDLLRAPRPVLVGFAVIGAGGAALAAIQLVPVLAEAAHVYRASSLPWDFVARFSFPPENTLTLLAPDLFGTMFDRTYWGRAYLWEMTLFLGVAALPLVVLGCGGSRDVRPLAWTALALFVIALGVNTPLLRALYLAVPGFDRFRGTSKFLLPASALLAMLAAHGVARLVRGGVPRSAAIVTGAVAVLVAIGAGVIGAAGGDPPAEWWGNTMSSVRAAADARGEAMLAGAAYEDAAFVAGRARHAARGLGLAAGVLALTAGLLAATRSNLRRPAALALPALVAVELALFAWPFRETFPASMVSFEPLAAALAERGDIRIHNSVLPNSGMRWGMSDISGYDPGLPRRMGELLQYSQVGDADAVTQYPQITSYPPYFAMLRFAAKAFIQDGRMKLAPATVPPLPRLHFVHEYEVIPDRDTALARLSQPGFDAARTVLLEEEPVPAPAAAARATAANTTARIVDESTDHLVVEANLAAPAILLITDAWHPFWRVESETGAAPPLLPANRVLRAIPLGAGEHRLRLEYRIPGFGAGAAITLASAVALIGAALAGRLRRRRSNLRQI